MACVKKQVNQWTLARRLPLIRSFPYSYFSPNSFHCLALVIKHWENPVCGPFVASVVPSRFALHRGNHNGQAFFCFSFSTPDVSPHTLVVRFHTHVLVDSSFPSQNTGCRTQAYGFFFVPIKYLSIQIHFQLALLHFSNVFFVKFLCW